MDRKQFLRTSILGSIALAIGIKPSKATTTVVATSSPVAKITLCGKVIDTVPLHYDVLHRYFITEINPQLYSVNKLIDKRHVSDL